MLLLYLKMKNTKDSWTSKILEPTIRGCVSPPTAAILNANLSNDYNSGNPNKFIKLQIYKTTSSVAQLLLQEAGSFQAYTSMFHYRESSDTVNYISMSLAAHKHASYNTETMHLIDYGFIGYGESKGR